MLQIYFLSIFFNLLAGYALISGDERESPETGRGFSLRDKKVRLILGVLCLAAGILKLLSSIGDIPILGDLLPACAGFVSGLVLVLENYQPRVSDDNESSLKGSFSKFLLGNKTIIGFGTVAIGALHFLFPRLLFL